jgi:hypothetical protein
MLALTLKSFSDKKTLYSKTSADFHPKTGLFTSQEHELGVYMKSLHYKRQDEVKKRIPSSNII